MRWDVLGIAFSAFSEADRKAVVRAMGDARLHIKERHIANCFRADPAYGAGVARALGLDLKQATE